ncbi:hypothetical protein ABNF97_17995 [Plantactinospora sp. B6F1]|uniref:hypothetical protein n=1 Tax=Plantactinospora sp. B6F1 TaxID=3158971 RepID=UPI0032D92D87
MPLVLGLCALLVLVGCEKQPPPTPSASTPSAGQLTTLPPPVVEAPDGGGIRVVEQGFSAMGDATGKPMGQLRHRGGEHQPGTGRGPDEDHHPTA